MFNKLIRHFGEGTNFNTWLVVFETHWNDSYALNIYDIYLNIYDLLTMNEVLWTYLEFHLFLNDEQCSKEVWWLRLL